MNGPLLSTRRVAVTLLAALGVLPFQWIRGADDPPWAAHPDKFHIVLVGDSTVAENSGWGRGFTACLQDDATCTNLARGGRSSKSFIAEGWWQKALALKPDYLLIQFGHNDQPGHGADRETDPQTTYRYFMARYVDEARTAGIKPVLITSLSRRQWGADGKIHSTLFPWVDVVKEIAAEKHVPLVDLHTCSIEFYEKEGPEKILELCPLKNADPKFATPDPAPDPNKGHDGTHLNAKGSEIIGHLVAEEVKKIVPDLAVHLK